MTYVYRRITRRAVIFLFRARTLRFQRKSRWMRLIRASNFSATFLNALIMWNIATIESVRIPIDSMNSIRICRACSLADSSFARRIVILVANSSSL